MIIPITCFTCGKPIAHIWEKYIEEVTKEHKKKNLHYIKSEATNKITEKNTIERKTLDKFKLKRYCCRRMILTHVDICEKI